MLSPYPKKGTRPFGSGRNGTVVLFGEVLADIFPDRSVLGGAPFNVARHLKAFKQHPVVITRLGHDELRDKILGAMSREGMDLLGVQYDNNHPTGQVQVNLKGDIHSFDILPEQAYDFIHPDVARMAMLSANPELVYFGTLAQRCATSKRALKSLLRNADSRKFMDINLRAPWYSEKTIRQSLEAAHILKLNADEMHLLAEMFKLEYNNPHTCIAKLMTLFNLEQVVVTCGDKGAWQTDRDGTIVETGISNKIEKVVDTVGAGDGFAAVFILGALKNWPVDRTMARANDFAAAICGIRGAVPDHDDFYEPFIREWQL